MSLKSFDIRGTFHLIKQATPTLKSCVYYTLNNIKTQLFLLQSTNLLCPGQTAHFVKLAKEIQFLSLFKNNVSSLWPSRRIRSVCVRASERAHVCVFRELINHKVNTPLIGVQMF